MWYNTQEVKEMNTNFLNVTKEMSNILKEKKVLLACSTGVDSTVLLDLLLKTKETKDVVIAHVNHQKRTESVLEEAYIKEYCENNNLKCFTLKLPKEQNGNFQEWARNKRYQFFKEIIEKEHCDILLTAHHADDNLETILMRFIKGSSLKGYAGIAKMTSEDNYDIYRPLLNVSKKEILDYAKENNIKYFEDVSNSEDDYTRNRIRKYLVPVMLQENPSLYNAVSNYSNTLFESSKILEEEIKSFIKNEVVYDNNIISIKIESLLKETIFFQTELLFSILKKYELSTTCINEIIKKINAKKTKIVSDINNDLVFIKEYGNIIFVSKEDLPDDFHLEIKENGTYTLPFNKTLLVDKNKCFLQEEKGTSWYNIPELPIIVRTRKDGDTLHFSSGTKTVSNYLTDKKVSHIDRLKVLLICDKDNQPMYIIK